MTASVAFPISDQTAMRCLVAFLCLTHLLASLLNSKNVGVTSTN